MKIFVTVGHTRFDSLFAAIDRIHRPEWHFVCQVYDGEVKPNHAECITFVGDIRHFYQSADVVVTHAGAGTVYSLLEIGKPTMVIANVDRLDAHQEDLLHYVESHNLAMVCRDLAQLEGMLDRIPNFQPAAYKPEPFNAGNEIAKRLGIV
ncbi:PssE/Cps14G family polysaccharide biosynthesis glycosyltransferase [Shewanella sp. FJAT-52076]|uniref:PssE/Cps14G family polysaccharide biosynthesis glycosyltransferase n=1 Tax=Shewanella sp. FJAT-52076 TaxID=2864202 RepID=UPI001C658392|nr:PssE/Cps14G family polysaccharide biosynthesis glycosyltransferase [Shewanella sp. FJAT-52076]QYJ74041.1 hypothetical protein K0H79_11700 [Shewanella sp. FJAT-52076]